MNKMKTTKNEKKVYQASNLIPNCKVRIENIKKTGFKLIFLPHVRMEQKVNYVNENNYKDNYCYNYKSLIAQSTHHHLREKA